MSFSWVITVLSLIGVILNIYKNKWCFVTWLITNLLWAIVDFSLGIYAQGVLFTIYAGLAVWGLVKWSKEKEN